MRWELDKNRPICPQIEEQICVKISKGELLPQQKLLSVRDVALEVGVNPNTVQKAFEILERDGLIYSVRGSGWFVSDSVEIAKTMVEELTKRKTSEFFNEMMALGYECEKIKAIVKEWEQ